MAGADWSSLITVNVFLAPAPPGRAGFGTALFLVDQDDGNSLNGVRVAEYFSSSEAETAQAAGYISADTLLALQAGFSQIPTPASIKVAYRDTGTSETMAAALTAIEALDTDWYGTAIYSRADADILAWGALIETRKKLFVAQSDDSSWTDAGLPAGLSTLAGRERTAVIFHDADTEPADLAWLVSRLVFDPDETSAPWEGQVRGVAALTTGLTSAKRGFIEANYANVGLPFSSANYYVSPGVNCANRAIYEILTGDWFAARVAEDFAAMKLAATARGSKLIVDATGQAAGLGILNQWLATGEAAGHFPKGQTRATAYAITTADETAHRLRFKVEAQIASDARVFDINVYLQPSALQTA